MTQTFVALPFQKLIPFWRDGVFCVCASICVLNGLHESTLDFTVHDPWYGHYNLTSVQQRSSMCRKSYILNAFHFSMGVYPEIVVGTLDDHAHRTKYTSTKIRQQIIL